MRLTITNKRFLPGWYPVAVARGVMKRRPRRVEALGLPLVLWRDGSGKIVAHEDRCPHRQVPLSAGKIIQGEIRCPYHGWQFDGSGNCTAIPCEIGFEKEQCSYGLKSFPCIVSAALVWVWFGSNLPISHPPAVDEVDWTVIRKRKTFFGNYVDVIENFIDSAHTPFLHQGIIRRQNATKARKVTVTQTENHISASHEPVIESVGPFVQLLNPKSRRISHTDTITLPGYVEVEYGFEGKKPFFLANIYCTPLTTAATDVFIILRLRFGLLGRLVSPLISFLASIVMRQDAALLALQSKNLQSFGPRHDIYPKSDFLHRSVRALFQRSEQDEVCQRGSESTQSIFELKV